MFCVHCGNQINDNAAFCPYCGSPVGQSARPEPVPEAPAAAPVPEMPVFEAVQTPAVEEPKPKKQPKEKKQKAASGEKKSHSWLFALVGAAVVAAVAAALILTGVLSFSGKGGASQEGWIQGDGFDTPEEAIRAYAEGLKAQDLDAIMSTCLIESAANIKDGALRQIYSTAVYSPTVELKNPTTNPLAQELNEDLLIANTENFVRYQMDRIAGRLTGADNFYLYTGNDGTMVDMADELDSAEDIAEVRQKISVYDLVDLSGMEIGEVFSWGCMNAVMGDAVGLSFLNSLYRQYSRLQVEGVCPQAITLSIQGKVFILVMDAVKVNGRWYNWARQSSVAMYLDMPIYSGGIEELSALDSSMTYSDLVRMEQEGKAAIVSGLPEIAVEWNEEHQDYAEDMAEIIAEYGTNDDEQLLFLLSMREYNRYYSVVRMTYEEMLSFFCLDEYLK